MSNKKNNINLLSLFVNLNSMRTYGTLFNVKSSFAAVFILANM